MRRCLARPTLAAAPPYWSLARVRTSAITSRSPARATMSSSPMRRRKLRVTMVNPCASRKAQALFSASEPVWRRSTRAPALQWAAAAGRGVERRRSAAADAHPVELAAHASLRVQAQRAGETLGNDRRAALQRTAPCAWRRSRKRTDGRAARRPTRRMPRSPPRAPARTGPSLPSIHGMSGNITPSISWLAVGCGSYASPSV